MIPNSIELNLSRFLNEAVFFIGKFKFIVRISIEKKSLLNEKALLNYKTQVVDYLPSILSLSACKASFASPKVGFASATLFAAFLTAAFTCFNSSALKIAV